MNSLLAVFLIIIIQNPGGEIETSVVKMGSYELCFSVSKIIKSDFTKLHEAYDLADEQNKTNTPASNKYNLFYAGCNDSDLVRM